MARAVAHETRDGVHTAQSGLALWDDVTEGSDDELMHHVSVSGLL